MLTPTITCPHCGGPFEATATKEPYRFHAVPAVASDKPAKQHYDVRPKALRNPITATLTVACPYCEFGFDVVISADAIVYSQWSLDAADAETRKEAFIPRRKAPQAGTADKKTSELDGPATTT